MPLLLFSFSLLLFHSILSQSHIQHFLESHTSLEKYVFKQVFQTHMRLFSEERGFPKSSAFSLETATRAELLRKSRKHQFIVADPAVLHTNVPYFKESSNKPLSAAEIWGYICIGCLWPTKRVQYMKILLVGRAHLNILLRKILWQFPENHRLVDGPLSESRGSCWGPQKTPVWYEWFWRTVLSICPANVSELNNERHCMSCKQ